SINGTTTAQLTTSDWQQQTVYLGTGSQSLQWVRAKNSPQFVWEAAWLDEVSYVAGTTAPIVSVPPTDLTVSAGTTATFTVGAVGTPPLTYQWRFNGADISGATNAILKITDAQTNNAGTYYAIVSNPYGSASSNANLIVTPRAPIITAGPASVRAVAHTTAR